MFKLLKPLVMMQLKDKIDLSYLKSKKQAITKIVLSILAFVLITAVIFVMLFLCQKFKILHLIGIIPTSAMVFIFTIMEALALISCIYGLMKTLYFSKDNPVLLTLPVSTNQVFLSKLIVYFIYELKKILYFIVPLCLAYGLVAKLPIYFYLWLVFCWLLLSILNVSLSGLFSILAMFISMFLRNFSIVKIVLFLSAVGCAIWILVSIINLIPANLDIRAVWGVVYFKMRDFLELFSETLWPFEYLTTLIIGGYKGLKAILFTSKTLLTLSCVVGVIVLFLAMSFLISRPLFFKMAAKPFEYRKITRDFKRKNKRINPFISSVKSQALLIARTSDDMVSLMSCAIALPILILLLNKIFIAMSVRALGEFMTVAINMLIILLVALATNAKIASVYSREGSAAYLNKTRPNRYSTNLIAKLIPNATIMTISIIVSVCIFANLSSLSGIGTLGFAMTAIFMYLVHVLWSAESDIVNPQTQYYATTGEHNNNPNETKSTITMFIISVLTSGVGLFLLLENARTAWTKIAIIAGALLIFRVWSYLSKIKYYYKEK